MMNIQTDSLPSAKRSNSEVTVAVIIPAHNAEKFIDQALASLVTQTRAADEIIVFDDGSDDGTLERAKSWERLLPLKVLRSTEQSGAWFARNEAIKYTSSCMIALLDADDMFLPQHLEELLAVRGKDPKLIAPRRLLWEYPDSTTLSVFSEKTPDSKDQLVQLLLQNYVSGGAMFPRCLFDSIGGYQSIKYGHDWDLWIRMSALGAIIIKPTVPTYVYRMHPNNISSRVNRADTDVEVLRSFLNSTTQPSLRFVAKMSMIQRIGEKCFDLKTVSYETLRASDFCAPDDCETFPDDLFYVVNDADVGRIAIGSSEAVNGKLLVLSKAGAVILAGSSSELGFEVEFAPPGLAWSREAVQAERITKFDPASARNRTCSKQVGV